MNKLNPMQHAGAASAALLITFVTVWALAGLGYPAPAGATIAGKVASAARCAP